MDKALEIFIAWQTIALSMAVWMIVFVIRRVIETRWSWMKTNKYWTDLFLPVGPIATGVLIGIFAKQFPWPSALAVAPATLPSMSARMMYAGICGYMSGYAYARVKAFFKVGVPADAKADGKSNPPPAGDESDSKE